MRLLPASLLLALASAVAVAEKPLAISKSIYKTANIAFKSFAEPKPFGSYLQMTLDVKPVTPIFNALNKLHKGQLKNRGEAHITVVTPPEFDKLLAPTLTIKEIEAIAKKYAIQRTHFKVVCVGRGVKGTDIVYYVIVESEQLVKLRWAIWHAFVKKGGEPSRFDPEAFWPHITVGFTTRDLFFEDNVFKNVNSCYKDLVLSK